MKDNIKEEILQEKFRQFIVNNNVAMFFVIAFVDDFKVGKDNHGVWDTINILKDDDNYWNVWEFNGVEKFMGYFEAEYSDIKKFNNQEDAYVDALNRIGIEINKEEFFYDENDTVDILNTIHSAKEYPLRIITLYRERNVNKLINRYNLLDNYEKELKSNKRLIKKH